MAFWITIGNRFINMDACIFVDPTVSGYRLSFSDGLAFTARRSDEIRAVENYLAAQRMDSHSPEERTPHSEPARAKKKASGRTAQSSSAGGKGEEEEHE